MRMWLIGVLGLSVLFAFLLAAGGAGIFGSPFAPDPAGYSSNVRAAHNAERLLMALTILAGPLGCGAALAVHRRSPALARLSLGFGAIGGALLGAETRFVHVWETVFLIAVWLPMIWIAFCIKKYPRRPGTKTGMPFSEAADAASVAVQTHHSPFQRTAAKFFRFLDGFYRPSTLR
jgi:hypothetical protein